MICPWIRHLLKYTSGSAEIRRGGRTLVLPALAVLMAVLDVGSPLVLLQPVREKVICKT